MILGSIVRLSVWLCVKCVEGVLDVCGIEHKKIT